MIKAIFFDWFHTLARFEPPREELHRQAYQEFGIEIPLQRLALGLLNADKYWFEESNKLSLEKRTSQEQAAVALQYQDIAIAEAGVTVPRERHLQIVKRVRELSQGVAFVLYDDVLQTLKVLKERQLILGLLTNANKDMLTSRELGLEPYLDFMVTSAEVGANKPAPPIFLAALDRAKVPASAAIHVGDQYYLDVVGAQQVGIKPVLIDRYGFFSEVSDCPVIRTLPELTQYL